MDSANPPDILAAVKAYGKKQHHQEEQISFDSCVEGNDRVTLVSFPVCPIKKNLAQQ